VFITHICVQEYGFSDKVGAVYHGDSDNNPPSPETMRLIESEIQEYVNFGSRGDILTPIFRFIQRSITRTTVLLESKVEELHKVGFLAFC